MGIDGEDRRLKAIGGKKKPPKTTVTFIPEGEELPEDRFAKDLGQAISTADQIVSLVVKGGQIIEVLALNDDRHSILGVLSEAYEVYQDMTRPR